VPQFFGTLLVFDLGGQRFGIPLTSIREVVRIVTITQVPETPPIVEGVINLRGSLVPVVDIRARFKLPAKAVELSDQLVVAVARSRVIAIRVDQVIDLVTPAESDIEDVKQVAPNSTRIAGVAKLPDGMVMIHDLASFLSAAEAVAFRALEDLEP
jgi:purine-binding chemotaxis protein CheW